MTVTVREARAGDGPVIHALISELAAHHDESLNLVSTPEQLEAVLIQKSDHRGCFIAEVDGVPAGLAYWYTVFTTFAAREKLYLEDLVVDRNLRQHGVAKALMGALARLCIKKRFAKIEWAAAHSNAEGQAFYTRIGGQVRDGYQFWHLRGEALRVLAEAD